MKKVVTILTTVAIRNAFTHSDNTEEGYVPFGMTLLHAQFNYGNTILNDNDSAKWKDAGRT